MVPNVHGNVFDTSYFKSFQAHVIEEGIMDIQDKSDVFVCPEIDEKSESCPGSALDEN